MPEQPQSIDQPPKPPILSSHQLSWIAMVAMAGMCLLALIYAASLNVG